MYVQAEDIAHAISIPSQVKRSDIGGVFPRAQPPKSGVSVATTTMRGARITHRYVI